MFTLNTYSDTQQNLSLPNLISTRTLNLERYCVTVLVISHNNGLPRGFTRNIGTTLPICLGANRQLVNAKSLHLLQENSYDAAWKLYVRTYVTLLLQSWYARDLYVPKRTHSGPAHSKYLCCGAGCDLCLFRYLMWCFVLCLNKRKNTANHLSSTCDIKKT